MSSDTFYYKGHKVSRRELARKTRDDYDDQLLHEEIDYTQHSGHVHTEPKRLFNFKLMVVIGLVIIGGTIVSTLDIGTDIDEVMFHHQILNALGDMYDDYNGDFNLIIGLEDEKVIDVIEKTKFEKDLMAVEIRTRADMVGFDVSISKITEIINFADAHEKNEWKDMVEYDKYPAMEKIEDRINAMDCQQMVQAFIDNTGWTLRGYLAHMFVERC